MPNFTFVWIKYEIYQHIAPALKQEQSEREFPIGKKNMVQIASVREVKMKGKL